jgi:signal transduction histidine kinase
MLSFDEGKFIQLLHNIFSNFVKYAGHNKTLTIQSIEKDEDIHIIFQDNGNGVQKKEVAFIREKFYQVDKSRSA